ncbi:MAG: hydroxyacylglutathione hydrolase [Legionellales bacterium RIFCSPHIGHO2_12_FULL_37_14]|nr:MAG: hydroxyacylglutathione hydrolase [Legionellales bacterium RIFCSPHIGHO2_12_FULL_37_14]
MHILPIKAFVDNYIWALINSEQEIWVVDPGEASPVIDFINMQTLKLQGILITHHHGDHTNGVPLLLEHKDVPVYGPKNSPCSYITTPLADNSTINLDSMTQFEILTIPGHTLDHIAYYGNGILFCGDTLFAAGCGRVFEGTYPMMFNSLMRLYSLAENTKIYCGHEYTLANLKFATMVEPLNEDIKACLSQVYSLREKDLPSLPSTLAQEKKTNPFLRCNVEALKESIGQNINEPVKVFEYLRKWKNSL